MTADVSGQLGTQLLEECHWPDGIYGVSKEDREDGLFLFSAL